MRKALRDDKDFPKARGEDDRRGAEKMERGAEEQK
jgi:hypothetical protein